MAPQTRSRRGEVGKSAATKTRSSTIDGGGGKGKVTRSSTIGVGGGTGKVTRSNTIGGGGGKGKVTRSSTIGGGGGKGKVTRSCTIGGGGKGKVSRSSTIGGGGRKGNETTSKPDISYNSGDSDDSDDSSDPCTAVARQDKDTVLARCCDMKTEFQVQSKEKLESLAGFLIQKGALEGRTCQETYHRALVDLIERNRPLPVAVAKEFSQRIGEYVAMRLYNTAKVILPLLSVDWDTKVVVFILELIKDLDDIELKVPQLQAISALGDCYLRAPQGGSEPLIADSINQHVLQWIKDSSSEYEMMRVWAKSPSWIIDTGKHDRSRISF